MGVIRLSRVLFGLPKFPDVSALEPYLDMHSKQPQNMENKRVIVTPAVYPRLDEPLHFDIQSTGQKSHCVNINL